MDEIEIKEKSTNHYSLAYDRPEEVPSGFLNFIYNKKTGEVLGRNAMSWAKITGFYIIFYICLGIFFVTCYKIFSAASLSDNKPRWILDQSLIGSNPGVGFRPMPDQDKNTDSSLIWINTKMEIDVNTSYWVDELNNFLKTPTDQTPENSQICSFTSGKTSESKICKFNPTDISGCNQANGYGYYYGTPCVLIKLNKIYGFEPTPYTVNSLDTAISRGMPADLQKLIKVLSKSDERLNSTWISCEGENPGDKENIGMLEYYAPGNPTQFRGIPNYFYPYLNQVGYQTPFLFVKFTNPRRNVLIQIECKAWAQNIQAERTLRIGSVHFELLID